MRNLTKLASSYYIVVAFDNTKPGPGFIWSFRPQKRTLQYVIEPVFVEAADDVPHYTKAQAERMLKWLQRQDPDWWEQPLEDYDDLKKKRVLIRATMKLLHVTSHLSTPAKKS